jgi:hypothetical protein
MTADEAIRPRAREDVVFRAVGDEWVLYDPETRQLHVLNLTAALVWTHCDGDHAVDDMVQAVAGAFPDAPGADGVRDDVRDTLGTFADEGLLR